VELIRRIRAVVAEPGDPGSPGETAALGAALRDAGVEVIYAGSGKTPAQIVQVAVQEDASVVGLNLAAGRSGGSALEVLRLLRAEGVVEPRLVVRADLAAADIMELLRCGVAAVFPPGAPPGEIAKYIMESEKEASR
jgi:methylmalonyl-CoA mutase, C-terminal domain